MIEKIVIENFKCFNGRFELEFNKDINILVGNNGVGKSTIIEAIHMALSGTFKGKSIKSSLNEYFFNRKIVEEYLKDIVNSEKPKILIELYVNSKKFPNLQGDDFKHSKNYDVAISGISLIIEFDEEEHNEELNELISDKNQQLTTLPVEWYKVEWKTFARKKISSINIPIKSSFIDISNGNNFMSESNLSRIIRNTLEEKDKMKISQSFRSLKQKFSEDIHNFEINKKINLPSLLQDQNIELNIDLGIKSIWENSLITHLDKIPYDMIGKGEQAIMKIAIALSNEKSDDSQVILIEEPESHISHTKLNKLLKSIKDTHLDKQLIISTHSSFVSNKLGLNSLILLKNDDSRNEIMKSIHFKDLDRIDYFKKLSGYDTLRQVLSNKVVLVEGPSDELIFQKAYMKNNKNRLPIEDEIEIFSVGTGFLNFLEIAKKLNQKTIVLIDNDGNLERINEKFKDYNNNEKILIFYENETTQTSGIVDFNYNTLEPYLLKCNNREKLNKILSKNYNNDEELLKYMKSNKTSVALSIFETNEDIIFPNYILDSVKKINEE